MVSAQWVASLEHQEQYKSTKSPRNLSPRSFPSGSSEHTSQHLKPAPPTHCPTTTHNTDNKSILTATCPPPQTRREQCPPSLMLGLPRLPTRPSSALPGTWASKLATVFEQSPLTRRERRVRSPRQIRVVTTPCTGTRKVIWQPSRIAQTSARVGANCPRNLTYKGGLRYHSTGVNASKSESLRRHTQQVPTASLREGTRQPPTQETPTVQAPKQAAEREMTPKRTSKSQRDKEGAPGRRLSKGVLGAAASTPRVMFGDDGVTACVYLG